MRRLYIVATPIGNLEDISLRALRVFKDVEVIAAEDTRTARVLLARFDIRGKRLVSYNEHNRRRRIPEILELLDIGDVALVSDAGTPAISDPGIELVVAARDAGHEVVSIPGPSAPIVALSIAGLPTDRFCFVGFLPRGAGELRRLLEEYATRSETLVAFESPQRLTKTLALLAGLLPDRRLAICRELTKLHEEVFVGTAAEALAHFEAPKGEIVLVIEGAGTTQESRAPADASVLAEVAQMRALGLTRTQATSLLQQHYAFSRRQAYELWLKAVDERTT
jgi:16S rRNA (cytidine1402-2'-O)-methyltransferase